MASKKTKNNYSGQIAAAGFTVAALTAGAYLMFGPDAAKHRKKVKGWAIKMKGEIIEKMEAAQEVSEPMYHKIVDQVAAKYAKLKDVDKDELMAVVEDVRKQWNKIHKQAKPKKVTKKATGKKTTASKKSSAKKTK